MSRERTIHLEPFIKIPKQYQLSKKTIRVCEIHGEKHQADKFCKQCGREIITKEIDVKRRLWCCNILGNENLMEHNEGNFTYLMSNLTGVCDTYTDPEDNKVYSLDESNIEALKKEFETKHASDIEILKRELEIKIEVDFGLIYRIW